MVEVLVRARWLAKGAAGGIGGKATPFGDRSEFQTTSDWSVLDPVEPAGSTYLRDGLLLLGVVAAGLLLGRRGTWGGASPFPSTGAGEEGADAVEPTIPEPAGDPGPPPERTQELTDEPGGPVLRQPEPQDAVPPTPASPVEPSRPEEPSGRLDEDLDRASAEEAPPGRSAGTPPSGEPAATAEEPPAAQETEPLAEEASGVADEPSPALEEGEVDLSPPPPVPNILDELPPPPVPEEQIVGDVAPAPPETEPTAEPPAEVPRAGEPRGRRRVTATSAARRRAKELGVDLFEVEGTGRDGKITVDDVRRSSEQKRP